MADELFIEGPDGEMKPLLGLGHSSGAAGSFFAGPTNKGEWMKGAKIEWHTTRGFTPDSINAAPIPPQSPDAVRDRVREEFGV